MCCTFRIGETRIQRADRQAIRPDATKEPRIPKSAMDEPASKLPKGAVPHTITRLEALTRPRMSGDVLA